MGPHRPCLGITLSFMAGIVLEAVCPLPGIVLAVVLPGLLVVGILCHRNPRGRMWVFWLLMALCGAADFRHHIALPGDHVISWARRFYGRPVTLEGIVVSDIQSRPLGRGRKTAFTMAVKRISESPASGRVLVVFFDPVDIRYGDRVIATGRLHRPFEYSSRGRLTYRSYLAQRQIFLMLTVKKGNVIAPLQRGQGNWIIRLALSCRSWLNRILERYLSPAEAGLMQALLTGERRDVPQHVRQIFFLTGTVHILAISGMNVAMVAFGVFLFLKLFPLGRRCRMILTVGIMAFYAVMTGGNSPVVRAAVMSAVFLLSFVAEREQDTVNTLACSALGILVMAPGEIFDVGFQLSFGSVLSILLFTPLILGPWWKEGGPRNRLLRGTLEAFAVSLAVMVGIGGLLVYYFQVVTPVALLANLPVIPLVGLATALGAGILFFGMLIPPLAVFFAACLKVTVNLMVLILFGFCHVPGGSIFLPPLWGGWVAGYYVIVVLCYAAACRFIRSRAGLWPAWQVGL